MIVSLVHGTSQYLQSCTDSLHDSDLGTYYFPNKERAQDAILEFINTDYFLVAIDDKNTFLGFICYLPTGAFHAFPYLHLLVTSKSVRGLGVGTLIMDLFEELIFKQKDKLFLVVADFNPRAKEFYIKRKYKEIGNIPSLYRKGINECLLMKAKD